MGFKENYFPFAAPEETKNFYKDSKLNHWKSLPPMFIKLIDSYGFIGNSQVL
jgi:hypothetical protein